MTFNMMLVILITSLLVKKRNLALMDTLQHLHMTRLLQRASLYQLLEAFGTSAGMIMNLHQSN